MYNLQEFIWWIKISFWLSIRPLRSYSLLCHTVFLLFLSFRMALQLWISPCFPQSSRAYICKYFHIKYQVGILKFDAPQPANERDKRMHETFFSSMQERPNKYSWFHNYQTIFQRLIVIQNDVTHYSFFIQCKNTPY